MDKVFMHAVLSRHVDDCAEDTVAVVRELGKHYGWSDDVVAGVARVTARLVCEIVQKTAGVIEELHAAETSPLR
jgi:hypothetical protein